MSENRAITVMSERRQLAPRALAGGIVGADLGLLSFIAAQSFGELAVPVLLVTLIPAIGAAGVVALAAYIVQQRRGPLSRLNRDLLTLDSLMERRLVSEEDYLALKQRIINDYQPQRLNVSSIAKPALWAALAASLMTLAFFGASVSTMYVLAPFQTSFLWMLLAGAGGAVGGGVSTGVIHRLLSPQRHPELPAGEPDEWQALGTHQPLSLSKK